MVSLTEPELKALMLAGLDGDQAAHGRLLAALAPRLRAYFTRRVRQNAADVEDLVQDTLLAIHLKRGMYDPTQPLTPWVLAIARYKLIDAWRRKGARPTEPLGEDDDLPGPDDHEGAMARRDLDQLLAKLPPRQGALLRDVKVEGLSMAEAAQRRNMSVAAVKVALHRSLKALQALVGVKPNGGDRENG
jgi:RNA polymerase sigma-70 factor (ECF subfamily)